MGLFDDHTLRKMNKIIFNVFFPMVMFSNIYSHDIMEAFNPKLLIFGIVTAFVIFFSAVGIVTRFVKDNPTRGVLIQAQFRSNFILFALPVLSYIYGETNVGEAYIMIAIIVPMYNALAVVTFEMYRSAKFSIKKILIGISTNPIIIGTIIALIVKFANFTLPYFLDRTVTDLSKVTTPMALVILGGFFDFSATKRWLKYSLLASLSKLVLIPAILVPVAMLFGFRGVSLATLFIMFGAPLAVSSFTMAIEMEGNGELACQIVVFSSLGAILTFFLWIFLLRTTALI